MAFGYPKSPPCIFVLTRHVAPRDIFKQEGYYAFPPADWCRVYSELLEVEGNYVDYERDKLIIFTGILIDSTTR